MRTKLWAIVCCAGVLGGVAIAEAVDVDDRDHAVDWVVAGMEAGSRLGRPGGEALPGRAGRAASGVGAADTGARTGRPAGRSGLRGGERTSSVSQPRADTSVGNRGALPGGISEPTPQPIPEPAPVPTPEPAPEPTPEPGTGGATEDQLGIHVDVGASDGGVSGGMEVTGTDTDVSAGTEVTTGVDTGVDLNAEADAIAQLDDPNTILTSDANITDEGTTTTVSGSSDAGTEDLITDEADLVEPDDECSDPLNPCEPAL